MCPPPASHDQRSATCGCEGRRHLTQLNAVPRRRLPTTLAGLLLVALTLAAYLPALHAGFIWDDDAYVTANRTLRSLAGLRRIWLEPGAVPQYYPLTFTSLWLDYHLWGLQPFGYHLVNVLLHALAALLVWRVLRRLHVPGAWLAAAVFALHPMQVESVAWVTERKNVLSAVCALGALLVYLRGSDPPSDLTPWPPSLRGKGEDAQTPRGCWHAPLRFGEGLGERSPGGVTASALPTELSWRSYLAVCLLFLGALLSKSVTCTLPAVALLLTWWQRGTLERRTLWRLAPLFVLGGAMAAMTVWVERHHVGAVGEEWSLSFIERCLVAGRVLWFYPRTLLWPQGLTFMYPRWTIDTQQWWQYLFPLAVVALLASLYAARRWIGSGPLVATLCYAVLLLPALGFFNVYPMRYSFVADHFAYLPSIALIALAVGGAAALVQRTGRARRLLGAATGGAVVLVLGVLTARQCAIYHDLRTLWTDTLAKNPASWMAHNNLGLLLAAEGDREAAAAQYVEALQLKPDMSEAYNNLGVVLADLGRTDEAFQQFQQAIRRAPDYAEAHNNLGNLLQRQGRLDAAIAEYAAALRARPDYADAHANLAVILAAQGKTQAATLHFEQALRVNPESADAHNNFGNLLRAQGNLAAAVAHYAEALRLQPANAEAHNNLGVALALQGKPDEALAQLAQALRIKPDYAEAHSNTGNVLQAQGRLDAAIAQYTEALRLQPANADFHNNLGVVLLAQHRIPEAIAHFEETLRWKPDCTEARDNLRRARAMQ
jgi:tetratricopeptide (TPR) repeat protein